MTTNYAVSKKYTSFQNGNGVLVMTETTYEDGTIEYRRFTCGETGGHGSFDYDTQAAFKKALTRYIKINGAGYVQDDEYGYAYVKELDIWYR